MRFHDQKAKTKLLGVRNDIGCIVPTRGNNSRQDDRNGLDSGSIDLQRFRHNASEQDAL